MKGILMPPVHAATLVAHSGNTVYMVGGIDIQRICRLTLYSYLICPVYRQAGLGSIPFLYPPRNEVVGGVYWFHSVRLSVRPSVRN